MFMAAIRSELPDTIGFAYFSGSWKSNQKIGGDDEEHDAFGWSAGRTCGNGWNTGGSDRLCVSKPGEYDARRLRSQREIIRDVMQSARMRDMVDAGRVEAVTRYGEASISAQLRHLPARGERRVT